MVLELIVQELGWFAKGTGAVHALFVRRDSGHQIYPNQRILTVAGQLFMYIAGL